MSQLWIITYDISDQAIRTKVCNILKNHGDRVQYSVFECWLKKRQLIQLRQKIAALLGQNDQVRWYPQCKWCSSKASWQGPGQLPEDKGFWTV